jgi:hypothetical protein
LQKGAFEWRRDQCLFTKLLAAVQGCNVYPEKKKENEKENN